MPRDWWGQTRWCGSPTGIRRRGTFESLRSTSVRRAYAGSWRRVPASEHVCQIGGRSAAAGPSECQTLVVGDVALYAAPSIVAVRALWDRSGLLAGPVIRDQLSQFAEALVDAHAAGEDSAAVMLRNWSDTDDELGSVGMLSLGHARLLVARDHGFATWSSVEGECDPTFELAVDAVVHGRIDDLSALLADHPDLPARRSAYGHQPPCCTTRLPMASRSVARSFPPMPRRSSPPCWMRARTALPSFTRMEGTSTCWRCSRPVRIHTTPV
jgi:hypothetical protein